MKSFYKIVWTTRALEELERTFSYLEQNFSERETNRLARKIDSTLALIAFQPTIYPETDHRKGVRKAIILRLNTLYYLINGRKIEILAFFANRQDPDRSEI